MTTSSFVYLCMCIKYSELFTLDTPSPTPDCNESSPMNPRLLNATDDSIKEISCHQNTGRDESSRMNPPLHSIAGDSFKEASYHKNVGWKLSFQRWYAMLVKRMLHSKRHKLSIVSQLAMPSIFVLLSLIVVKTMPKRVDSPSRLLNLEMFGTNFVPYFGEGQ